MNAPPETQVDKKVLRGLRGFCRTEHLPEERAEVQHAVEAGAADGGLLVREHRDDGGAEVVAHLGEVLRLRLLLLVTT